MVITCPACEARYRLGRDKIQGRGAKITCPKCSHVFVVFNEAEGAEPASRPVRPPPQSESESANLDRETTTGAFNAVLGSGDEGDGGRIVPTTTGKIRVVAPGKRGSWRSIATVDSGSFAEPSEDITGRSEAAEPPDDGPGVEGFRASDLNFREVGIKTWKVKVAIGLIYDFSDIATLKKYLGDKKVTADDLISHNNKEWTRIGDIPDLDAHFVATWKEAKHLIATGERPAVKRKKPAADDTGRVDATLSGSHPTASGLATAPGGLSTVPGAYGGGRARERARRKRQKEQSSSGPPVAVLVLGAIIVVGGLMAWNLRPDRNLTGDGPAPIAVNQVGDVSAAEMSDIARKIQDKLDRKTDEVTAQSAQEIQEAADDATAKKKTIAERIRDGEIIRVQPTPGSRIPLGKKKKYQTPQIQTKGPASTRSEPKKDVVVKPSKDPGQLYLTVARKKLASNDYGAAAKAARTAIQKSPNCKACWTTLGEAYQKLGKPQEAAEAFATAEKLAAGSGGSSQAGQ